MSTSPSESHSSASVTNANSAPQGASDSSAKCLKSLRNQRDYQRRKADSAIKVSEAAKDELRNAKAKISYLHHSNTQANIVADKLRTEAERSAQLLAVRTERFVVFRDGKEAELKRAKAAAKRKIEALEKQHELELHREEAKRYRLERSHVKEKVACESKLVSLQQSYE